MALQLKIIIGSTRPGRVGPNIARWVAELAREHTNFDVELVDLLDLSLPLLDEAAHPKLQHYEHQHTRCWSKIVASADAFVFVTPEYDGFPPAALINALQYLLNEWAEKPAGIVSYGGISAGLRASQALRQILGILGVVALPQSVPVPFFSQFIGQDGIFRPNERMEPGAKLMLNELQRWASTLREMREPTEN